MENSGSSSMSRHRRLRRFLNTSSGPTAKGTLNFLEKDAGQKCRADVDVNEDGLSSKLISCVRVVTCFITMMVTTLIWALIMLVLLPWPYKRLRQGNVYGHVTGRLMSLQMWKKQKIICTELLDNYIIELNNEILPVHIAGGLPKEQLLDIFLCRWYSLFGQLYVLANHFRIDRSNPTAAIESLKEAAQTVVRKNLSLIIFPEGTRSADGRLLPFKKGIVHLSWQTGLPIVPIVLIGTHRAWRKGSLRVLPTPLTVKYLSPIRTDGWRADKIDEYIKMIHDLYAQHLPENQRPFVLAESRNGTKS